MMIVNRLKLLPMALVIATFATGALAEGTATEPVTGEAGRTVAPVTEMPAAPRSEAFLWEFAGVPRKGKAVLVNVPSFELIAFEDGIPVLRSKVIVGTRQTQTPIKRTRTSVVRFRPFWTPTPDMIRRGTRPGTRSPGRSNPLGLLAVRLEPGSLIYLHATNQPRLFKRDNRSLSNGCVRVEKWDQVAAFVLNTTINEVHRYANGRRTFDMDTNLVPVIFGYFTSFPDADGNWQTYRDIYRRGRADPGPEVAGGGESRISTKARNAVKSRSVAVKRANSTADASDVKPATIRSAVTPIGPEDRTFKLQQ